MSFSCHKDIGTAKNCLFYRGKNGMFEITSPCPGYGGGYPHKISEIPLEFLSFLVIFDDFP